MTSNVAACRPETNLAAVAGLMWHHDCGVIPVIDGNQKVIGVITDRDICMAVAMNNRFASEIAAGDLSRNPSTGLCISPSASCWDIRSVKPCCAPSKPARGGFFFLTLQIVLALSVMFELLESWVAQIVSPELGAAYLGTQGDNWDAQNDTTAALIGALLCFALTAAARKLADPQSRRSRSVPASV